MKTPSSTEAQQKKSPRGWQLFRRLPKLNWQEGPKRPFIPSEEWSKYPDLIEDLELLATDLMPRFYELDNKALQSQNQFWLEQLVLLVGSALAAILGAVQIALIKSPIPGIVETIVTILLAAVTYRVRAFNAQKLYFTNRLAAETLRGEYYLFLGRLGDYDDEENRQVHLDHRVSEIVVQSRRGGVR